MREYQNKLVQEMATCTCDRCGRRMTPDGDPLEWYEKVSLDWCGGLGSVFGDGAHVSVDLCQQCVRDTLGPWLRIDAPSTAGTPEALRSIVCRPGVPVNLDRLNPTPLGEQEGSRQTLPVATRLSKMVEQATAVFGDGDKAIRWLCTPHRQFGGRAALAMARTEHDALLVEEALVRIDEGYL
jgi:hypothetical protein